jgi:hypothetical protein
LKDFVVRSEVFTKRQRVQLGSPQTLTKVPSPCYTDRSSHPSLHWPADVVCMMGMQCFL